MKFDHDLARELLIRIELEQQAPEWELVVGTSEFPRFYTGLKLLEAGYIKGERVPGSDPDEEFLFISGMTFAGHEFLDTVRDGRIWGKTKEAAKKVGGAGLSVLFEIGKAILKEEIRKLGMMV